MIGELDTFLTKIAKYGERASWWYKRASLALSVVCMGVLYFDLNGWWTIFLPLTTAYVAIPFIVASWYQRSALSSRIAGYEKMVNGSGAPTKKEIVQDLENTVLPPPPLVSDR